ncbi:RNA-binding protein [Mesorhizobium sp. M4B.F.Ca.ET.215.01.1.1]|nr:RNA-binding protein [Mesorhizobium sp. M4B.F.Ca.ET.017.02.2.1]RWX62364.1 RNA-binding protein [Mesorhizobium sp. M4B.F.Ca.ET.089.01.1.1]TGQ10463.1 RNA-binding protein [Mesorhizobium sp. M4B.F.Ca.ET.215.01.1.1]TGQ34201.1 RNA-binding protein [Mesorhizobium sp. M00.F.Ca.ET.220.01.1.1]TGR03001.1 RNA-binding protein [Mesorhizobium sp. M4B.F.Ca.ET.203.01.1.1]TGR13409.1 RNA-binding protein [Mesorhizobium sp. M4B.F.Ca.ET.200.01.1.1]TGS21624.1 RNA-binding protein [Mesorhizobium sp. M4B.F.Ca.ET.190.0
MPLSHYSGVFEPADLDLLQRVFDQLCVELRLAQQDKEQREDLAADIVSVFRNGLTDEGELLQAVSKRRLA